MDVLVVWCPTWSKNLGRSLLKTASALLSKQHGLKICRKVYKRIFDTVSEIHSWIYVFVEVLVVSMISASASTLAFWQSSLFSKFEGSILVWEETETGFPFMLTEFFCNALKAISALAMALRVCVCCICNCNFKKKIVKYLNGDNLEINIWFPKKLGMAECFTQFSTAFFNFIVKPKRILLDFSHVLV